MMYLLFLLGVIGISLFWIIRQNHEIRRLRSQVEDISTQNESLKCGMDELRQTILHDLSAPLRAIHGFCEILQKQMKDSKYSEADEFLSLIHDNTVLMKSMIEDVREYFRVMNSPLRIESVDLNSLIEDCYKKCIQNCEPDSVQLNIQPLPSVRGDRELLDIMMTHILSNAIKFSNGRTPLVIDIRQDGESVAIQDNGVGFDMAYKDKVFKLFQRLHLKEQFEGNGAGLAVVNRIIQRHNGTISIESEPGHGTRVSFQIPEMM